MPAWDVRIFKSWGARNLDASWVNNYVLNWDGNDVGSNEVVAAINAIVDMERAFHLIPVQYLHATFSTTRDEPVYTPETLRVFELASTGARAVPVDDAAVDLNICLKVKKQVAFGRSGTMFYRGALRASEVKLNSRGEAELAPEYEFFNPGAVSNAYSHVSNLAGFEWIMKHPALDNPDEQNPVVARAVKGIAPSGVVVNKRNHRYFDELSPQIKRAVRWAIANRGSVNFGDLIPPEDGSPALPPAPAP